jgi:hypothetical protein
MSFRRFILTPSSERRQDTSSQSSKHRIAASQWADFGEGRFGVKSSHDRRLVGTAEIPPKAAKLLHRDGTGRSAQLDLLAR